MPISSSNPDSQQSRRRWPTIVLLAYGAVCVGLLGYFIAFPDEATQNSQAKTHLGIDPAYAAKKQGRYEGVIANWNKYRARNMTAEAK